MNNNKEILELNIRCAEFLGMENDAYILKKIIEKERFDISPHLSFHYDWNSIMEVSQCIVSEGFRLYTISHESFSRCVFTDMSIIEQKHSFGGGNIVSDSGECISYKESLIISINNFLIWYYANHNL